MAQQNGKQINKYAIQEKLSEKPDPRWWPKDLANYQEKVKPPPWNNNTFISIPNEMLELSWQSPKKITISDVWMLTFIARKASQEPDHSCHLYIKEIDNAMGPSTGNGNKPDSRVVGRLRKFECCGLIRVEQVHGRKRKSTIHVSPELVDMVLKAQAKETKSVLIGPEIFLLNLSIPVKTALGIKKAMPKIKATTLSEKMRITFQQAQNHLRFIQSTDWVIEIKTPPKLELKPPQNFNKTPPKLERGIDSGIGLGYSFNILSDIKGVVPTMKVINNPSILESDKNMQNPQVNMDQYLSSPRVRAKDFSNKKTPKEAPTPRIANDVLMELENEVFQHDWITTNKKPNALRNSAKVVKALCSPDGLSLILDKTKIDHIVQTMSAQKIHPLRPDQILTILHKQFSDQERVELYEKLSLSNSPAYGGIGRQPLSKSAYDDRANPGWSDIVWVCLRPPQLKTPIKPTPKTIPEFEAPIRMIGEKCSVDNLFFINEVLTDLKRHYDTKSVPFLASLEAPAGNFTTWFREFLRFAYNKHENNFHPGYLKLANSTFQEWDAKFRSEALREQTQRIEGRRAQDHNDMEKTIEDIIVYMDDHSPGEAWQVAKDNKWTENMLNIAEQRRMSQ